MCYWFLTVSYTHLDVYKRQDVASLKVDSTNRLFIVPVQAVANQNVYVDSVWLNTPFVREFQNNILYLSLIHI